MGFAQYPAMPLLSSPLGPITATFPALPALSGRALPRFFSSDALCDAPERATAVCSGEQMTDSGIWLRGPGGSCMHDMHALSL